jgi:hypothetical protein
LEAVVTDVRVRTETPMLGLAWGEEITLARTPIVAAAIADGRLTVIDAGGDPEPLRGELLDEALRSAGLPTTGRVADKQARLAAHQAGDYAQGGDLPAGGDAVNATGEPELVGPDGGATLDDAEPVED